MEPPDHAHTYAKVEISVPSFAKLIEHSLIHPAMTDKQIEEGLELAKKYKTATVCVKPYAIPLARKHLSGTEVGICAVVGFPHGNSSTAVKLFEAEQACMDIGAKDIAIAEINMVVNIGKVLSHDWGYVTTEIKAINDAITKHGAKLKVIFEREYLTEMEVNKLCKICTDASVAWVKTGTGYGFVQQEEGHYNLTATTAQDLAFLQQNLGPDVKLQTTGGMTSMEDVIKAKAFGADKVDVCETKSIMDRVWQCGFRNEIEGIWFDIKPNGELTTDWEHKDHMNLPWGDIKPNPF